VPDNAAVPAPKNLVTRRGAAILRREVVPFSTLAMQRSGMALVENPDPVLRYLALKGEEEWRTMERAETSIGAAKRKRINTLLSYGSAVYPANASADAKLISDFCVEMLRRIRHFNTSQRLMLDAIFWGWRPLEVMWDLGMEWKGRQWWGISDIKEKMPEQFRFNADRDLVYVGNGWGRQLVFNRPEDKLHWMVCTSGSTNTPYGDALYRGVWLIYYIKQRFMQMWAQGMGRSLGLVKVSQTADPSGQLIGESAKKMTTIVDEVRDVLRALNDHGVLIEKFGWSLAFLTDVDFSDAWKHPLQYCDECITLMMTGETLSMRIGEVGSKAAASVHQQGLVDFCKSDAAELEDWINDDLLAPAIELNFGAVAPEDIPRWRSKITTQVDLEKARIMYALGAPLDGRKLADESGVPIVLNPTGDDLVLQKTDPIALAEATAKLQGANGMPMKQPPAGMPPKAPTQKNEKPQRPEKVPGKPTPTRGQLAEKIAELQAMVAAMPPYVNPALAELVAESLETDEADGTRERE
jgi:hypothetical protein